jgi:hypothetical protein
MGNYLTIADIRAEGVTVTMAADALVTAAIADVARRAEAAARTWWEARTKTLYVNGNGRERLHLDYPLITLTSLTIDDVVVTGTIVHADPVSGLTYQLRRPVGQVFNEGDENVVIVGSFGTVDMSGATPATPADIKWALKRWAYLLLSKVTDEDAAQERRFMAATSVNMSGRSMSRGPVLAPLSGDPEVDRIVTSYRRARVAVI